MSVRRSKRQLQNGTVRCTGCEADSDADYLHPKLKVPICGACNKAYAEGVEFDEYTKRMNMSSDSNHRCLWCSDMDSGLRLFLCDTCPHAFCFKCVNRNFGPRECSRLENDSSMWSCYYCIPIPAMIELQRKPIKTNYNIESIYAEVQSPTQLQAKRGAAKLARTHVMTEDIQELFNQLAAPEKNLAAIFSDYFISSTIANLRVYALLTAADLMNLRCLSKKLRLFFLSINMTPGLFQTPYGIENQCKLYPHQLVSLEFMRDLESCHNSADIAFGTLRGGILADSPGLGKTITMLALITTTSGVIPRCPPPLYDPAVIDEAWKGHAGNMEALVRPALNGLLKSMGFVAPILTYIFEKQVKEPTFLTHYPTIHHFEKYVLGVLKNLLLDPESPTASYTAYDIATEGLRLDFERIKDGLEKKKRSLYVTAWKNRLKYERTIRPSSATLVIVPLALLEHWYEQLNRHLGLAYQARNPTTGRGVVYLDGLGDIVDVIPPLSNVRVPSREAAGISVSELSQFLVVVTTFERCQVEAAKLNLSEESSDSTPQLASYHSNAQLFLKIRWLRLIVDEGHELGFHSTAVPAPEAKRDSEGRRRAATNQALVAYVSKIAAERRWVMTGTPTTGTHTRVALEQIYKLLTFLRHPGYGLGSESRRLYESEVVLPVLQQAKDGTKQLVALLKSLMIRHTKADLNLHEPVRSAVVLDPRPDPANPYEDRVRWIDRAKAMYIVDVLLQAKEIWRNKTGPDRGRRPKAIVFSKESALIQGAAHFLYTFLGDRDICEHFGAYRSVELSRFRHSRRRYKVCPMCGHENGIASQNHCGKRLLLVEYLGVDENAAADVPVCECGGSNGYYQGFCLCSPVGCDVFNTQKCYPNPLHWFDNGYIEANGNIGIIAEEHVLGYEPGRVWTVDQQVHVVAAPYRQRDLHATRESVRDFDQPVLWHRGRRGGPARVVMWMNCGGHSLGYRSWFGDKILPDRPWLTQEEDCTVLLLEEDGSTGLDLSFVTHIFLLDRIKDPALETQVISRAHRMGAAGPVQVHLVQVHETEDIKEV